jgi:hypothetical protein
VPGSPEHDADAAAAATDALYQISNAAVGKGEFRPE